MHNDWKGTGISQDTTLSWYRDNAIQYAEETRNSLVLDALWEFLSRMKEGGTILDYGSGSGRDSAYFLDKGFSVDSLDGSAEMKAQAESLFGIKVKLASFLSLEEKDKYDGIWAQASILHLEEHDLRVALTLIERALKRDGVFYSSFRKGEGDGYENGRWYTNMTERRFLSFLPASLYVEKIWESQDVRPRVNRTWLSIICRKKS